MSERQENERRATNEGSSSATSMNECGTTPDQEERTIFSEEQTPSAVFSPTSMDGHQQQPAQHAEDEVYANEAHPLGSRQTSNASQQFQHQSTTSIQVRPSAPTTIDGRENSRSLPTHGRVPPPAPPLVAEPARKEHGDDGTTFIDEVTEFGEEPKSRSRYRKRAVVAIIFGVLMAYLGSELIQARGMGDPGSCCLPARCDVMKLHRHWDGANHTSRMCNFTEAEWKVMGCWSELLETANCTMSEPRLDEDGDSTDWDPCGHNNVVGQMLTAGIQTTSAGGLCIVGGFFCFFAFDCFGGVYQKPSTRHWVARIVAFVLWFGAFGASTAGIAFGSMAARGVSKIPFQTRSTCWEDDANEDGGKFCKKDRRVFWEGEHCPLTQQPGDVFSWFDPTLKQRWFVSVSLSCCCIFTFCTLLTILHFMYERHQKNAARHQKKEKEKRLARIQLVDEANRHHNPMVAPPTSSASSSFHPSMTTQGGSLHQHLAPRQSYRQQQQHSNSSSANSREQGQRPTPAPAESSAPQEMSAFGAPPPPAGVRGAGGGYAPHHQYGGGGGSSQHTPPPSGTFEAPLVAGSVVAKQDPLAEPAQGMPVPQ